MLDMELSWPPSVNHYWVQGKTTRYISAKGKAFIREVILKRPRDFNMILGRVCVIVMAYPPDRRQRDLDNILKALGDALEKGRIIKNDSHIDRWIVSRCDIEKPGKLLVKIKEI